MSKDHVKHEDITQLERLKREEQEVDTLIGDSEEDSGEESESEINDVEDENKEEDVDESDSKESEEYEDEDEGYDVDVKDDASVKKDCMYDKLSVESEEIESEEEDLSFDDDVNQVRESNYVPSDKRMTKPIMTKYERVRILSDRIQQLTLGAKPMIKNVNNLVPDEIAREELKYDVIPLIIRRPRPDGEYELWYTKELYH